MIIDMKDPFKDFDNWLQSGNPTEEPDAEECDRCGGDMVFIPEVGECEESGRMFMSGGYWKCPSRRCGGTSDATEDDENI